VRTRKLIFAAVLAMLASPTMAMTCNLVVNGKSIWHGKCVTKLEGQDLSVWSHSTAYCHANGGTKKCSSAEACAGPWLNILQEIGDSENYMSYWSIEDSCHGGEQIHNIKKIDAKTYRGEGYSFTIN